MGEPRKSYLVKENGKGEWRWGFVDGDFPYKTGNEYVIKVTKVYPEPGMMNSLLLLIGMALWGTRMYAQEAYAVLTDIDEYWRRS